MEFPFQDHELPLEERLNDVISRLTLEEKCEQLRWDAPSIDRLGIPAYNWWNEALHGVGRNGRATVFPQAIGLASMWDVEKTEEVADAISDEARAKHHEAARNNSRQQYQGLTFWTPNINIFRDPRWGRGQETWGEDPFLTSELGAAFVRGLQGNDSRYLKTAACAKHFAVHSGPEAVRHEFDACPTPKDFRETYLPAFERLAKEGVEAFMGAYNAVYGEPSCGSKLLLKDILRDEWGFQGHVVSDCWAIQDFHKYYKVTANAEESAALALKNGCDLNCGSTYCEALEGALALKLIDETDVDRALRNLWRSRFKLGMFDPDESVPYTKISKGVINCDKHHQLAFETAVKSIILLKNKDNILPLGPDAQNLLLTGPLTTSVDAMQGNYFGMSSRISTVLEGMAARAPEGIRMDYRLGCLLDRPRPNASDWAGFEAVKSDVVICSMGLTPNVEGEEGDAVESHHKGDRDKIELYEDQLAYLKNVSRAIEERKAKTKIIVLLFGGSAIAIPEVHEFADAVLQVWYPGEAGGEAIAAILFGQESPGGRLPVTVPRSTADLPPYEDYSMVGRTYRYMDNSKILYPFGFGLSYNQTEFSALKCEIQNREANITVNVKNVGNGDDETVLQIYLSSEQNHSDQPQCKLVAFERLKLQAQEQRHYEITLDETAFHSVDSDGEKNFTPGSYELFIAGAAPLPCSEQLGAPAALSTRFSIN